MMISAICEWLSLIVVVTIFLCIPVYAIYKKVKIYEAFVEGAGEGFQMAIRIMPYLIAMFVALNIFRDSGGLSIIEFFLEPLTVAFGIPKELVPLALMRPLSGTGTIGITSDIINVYGVDSFLGRTAAIISSTSDTTFYIATVYFAATGVRKMSYGIWVGLMGDLISFLLAVYMSQYIF